jgi:hypothetical protein
MGGPKSHLEQSICSETKSGILILDGLGEALRSLHQLSELR